MIENVEHDVSRLRDELARRRQRRLERRYRWRWVQRWRRKRLLLKLLAIERDLHENPSEELSEVRHAEAARLADELARSARRLFS